MRKPLLILFGIMLLLSLFTSILYHIILTYALPGTKIGTLDISFKTRREVGKLLTESEKAQIFLHVKDRIYPYSYTSLGILTDNEQMLKTVFEPNRKPFPFNFLAFFTSFSHPKTYIPYLVFSQTFHQKVATTIYDFSLKDDQVFFNNTTKKFVYEENEEKYRLDEGMLKIKFLSVFGKQKTDLYPILLKVTHTDEKTKVTTYNQKLKQIYKDPITIAIQNKDETTNVTISPDEIKQVLGASYKNGADIAVSLDDQAFIKLLQAKNAKLFSLDENTEKKINQKKLQDDFFALVQNRFQGGQTDTVIAKKQYQPNTHGEIAQKYIEIDISQQLMYLWENTTNIAIYSVSTGLYYPTPTGKFKVLNKAKNAFSDIYNVWMPYWMAIYLDPKINAYIGIHELPYWITGNGQQIRRPRDFLGSPHTGGCISLDIGIAQKVQDWAYIGMPVYIYN